MTLPLRATLTVVYRGLDPKQTCVLSQALYAAGVRSFEVTTTAERPMEAIRLLIAELGDDAEVGVGTVMEPDQVSAAAEAGARFVVSPHVDPAVVERTVADGLVSIPAAFTPTEIVTARRTGAHVVKIFPINVVGAEFIRQVRGPLPDIAVMASGGVTPQLARECMAAGARMVAAGAHLFGAHPDGTFDPAELQARASEFLHASASP
jgi:Entner-Doudoroff aldolase